MPLKELNDYLLFLQSSRRSEHGKVPTFAGVLEMALLQKKRFARRLAHNYSFHDRISPFPEDSCSRACYKRGFRRVK